MYGEIHSSAVPWMARPTMNATSSAAVIAADISQPLTSIATKSERRRRLARRPYQAMTRLIATVAAA